MFYKERMKIMNLEMSVEHLRARIEILERRLADGNNFTGALLDKLGLEYKRLPATPEKITFVKKGK
jgi:hypothetical protein